MSYTLPTGKSLCMFTLAANMYDHNGLLWPSSGNFSAPNYIPTRNAAYGLVGLLWGEGETGPLHWTADAHWFVVEVDNGTLITLWGLVKFPSCTIVYYGDRSGATSFMRTYAPIGTKVAGAIVSVGAGGSALVGNYGTATTGNSGTSVAGDGGAATAGTGGTATAGNAGTAVAGDGGTATAGTGGSATTGANGSATAGNNGAASAGNNGTAIVGTYGVASAGIGGKAKAGDGGAIRIQFFNGTSNEWKSAAVGGASGVLTPDTFYKLNAAGAFVLA